MSRLKTGLSVGVLVALAIAIWAALASDGSDPDPTTTTTTAATSTTTLPTTSTTTTSVRPDTSMPDTTVDGEARLEEVQLILEDVWFGWFDAVYRNDEAAVHDVVATPERLENFRDTAAQASYERAPQPGDVKVTNVEILRDTPDCLVAYSQLDVSAFQGQGATSVGVDVMWPHEDGWRRATRWMNRGDLWESDCEADRSRQLP